MIKKCKSVFLLVVSAFLFQLNAQVPEDLRVTEWRFGAAMLRDAQAERELLDSVVTLTTYNGEVYDGNKDVWEYGSDGLTKQYGWYYWDTNTAEWIGRQRVDSTFTANGQLSMLINNTWDNSTKQWKRVKKSTLSYNPDGQLMLYSDYVWNGDANDWVFNSKSEGTHSYTENGTHIIFSINYTYDSDTGEWVFHHRNEQNFDSKGNLTLYNASFYDTGSDSWVFKKGSFKYENTFNEQGQPTLSSYYVWDSGLNQWKGQGDLLELSYDSNGKKTSVVTKSWDVLSNQWVNTRKTENQYNEPGYVTAYIESEWDMENSLWEVVSNQELFYDAQGNIFKSQVLLLDTVSNDWFISTKEDYTYDVSHRETLKEYYNRNDDGELVLYKKKESVYDAYGNVTQVAYYMPDTEDGTFVLSEDTKFTYNESGETLIEDATSIYFDGLPYTTKSTYYYSMHTVSSIETQLEPQSAYVYPSLFSDKLTFHFTNTNSQPVFELFNAQGQKVVSKRVEHSETIYVSNLPRGVYVYTLSVDNNVNKGKIIKK